MSEGARLALDERRLWAAPGGSHDRLVGALRYVLPAGIGILGAFLVAAPLTSGGDVSFVLAKDSVEVAKERLKIQAAQYRGQDGKGQAFTLNAGSAVQKSSAEPIVRINDLKGQLQLKDGPAQLVAPSGRYDMDKEQVMADGPIRFNAPDGYSLQTRDATVDMKSRQLKSGGAVTGTVRQGTFSANGMQADLENRTVSLSGNARLRIVPRAPK